MKRNNQLIALFVFIPMLLFTLFITLMTQESTTPYDEAKTVIYKYFDYRNNKDINSFSSLLVNPDILKYLESEINETQEVSLIGITEEKSTKNAKVFKVIYLMHNEIKID